jgi:hypothetical protein
LAFAVDGWNSGAVNSYLSVTVHYATKDFHICRHMHDLYRIRKSHTAGYIKEAFKFRKLLIFIIGNGRNVVKAASMSINWSRILCLTAID